LRRTKYTFITDQEQKPLHLVKNAEYGTIPAGRSREEFIISEPTGAGS
jgi:hypothetical protein